VPPRNEVIFPAAILQPPFFDPKADMAVNYGGIGSVIGHEITHGFDDEGRHYDGNGALVDWWTPEDSAKFEAQTKTLAAQVDTYEVLPGVHVKGEQTMGENIADLGGVLMSLDAYHIALKGKPAPKIAGFSGDQRFFLGFGQVWQSKYQPDFMKFLVTVDVHSPDHFRPISATRNVDAWYSDFNVKPGDKYYVAPDKRVRIW
jgi:putative endopeptidase